MDLGDLFGRIDTDQLADLIDLVTKNRGSLEALSEMPAYLEKIATALGGAGERLADLAKAMDAIGDTLAKVGGALAKLGDHLDESGVHARTFAELG